MIWMMILNTQYGVFSYLTKCTPTCFLTKEIIILQKATGRFPLHFRKHLIKVLAQRLAEIR